MVNFAETLAYWYLRLNGFFPLTNFVLHRRGGIPRSADSDILAVRFPFVYEEIGGTPEDWDQETFQRLQLNINSKLIGLIVEVKSGYQNNEQNLIDGINRAFHEDRLKYALGRFGFLHRDYIDEITQHLLQKPKYAVPETDLVVGKLLVSDYQPDPNRTPPCMWIETKCIAHFVRHRMACYIDDKYADRMYFPSDLLQFIIWSFKFDFPEDRR